MDKDRLIENLTEQIKEAQLKLGYVKEAIRLYFPVQSMCRLLQIESRSGKELIVLLKEEKGFEETVLGKIHFTLCRTLENDCVYIKSDDVCKNILSFYLCEQVFPGLANEKIYQ